LRELAAASGNDDESISAEINITSKSMNGMKEYLLR
jgi:hypothetical protein